MSAIINGDSPSITFSDATTQATSAVVSGKVPYSILPAGSVLQVVNASYSTNVTTSSTSIATTGLNASITPKFSTSKILVIANMNGVGENSGTNGVHFEIYRGGSSITYWDDIAGAGAASANYSTAFSYLDSPATTSTTTYAVYWKRVGGGNAVIYINNYYKYTK